MLGSYSLSSNLFLNHLNAMLNMLQRRPVSETNTNMATSDRTLLDQLMKWQQPQQGSYFTLSNRCHAKDSYLLASSIDQVNHAPTTIGSYEKDREKENKRQLNNHHTMLGSSSILPTESNARASNKRKADRFHSGKVGCTGAGMEGSTKEKILLVKGDKLGSAVLVVRPEVLENQWSNNNNEKKEPSGESSKENSKAPEPMQDYIHVRARRGQATDRHSLAERLRREKISEKMTFLQDLVPGCNKITGKASMLDEIINYVLSLQKQVEFLSMKLACVNPSPEFNADKFFSKEVISSFFPVKHQETIYIIDSTIKVIHKSRVGLYTGDDRQKDKLPLCFDEQRINLLLSEL